MVASPKPPPPQPQSNPVDADRPTFRTFIEELKEIGIGGGRPPIDPPDPAKTIHNEVTKLKATTLNSIALAFFIGGGVAPLVGWAATGFSLLQAILGFV